VVIFNCRKVSGALKRKGFRTSSGKHVIYTFYYHGICQSVITHMSHNNQELDDYLLGEMAEQLSLSKNEFRELIECTFSEEDLIEKYLKQKLLSE
jgi:hypothetical protein